MLGRCVFLGMLGLALVVFPAPSLAQPETVPANFSDTVVVAAANIDKPTDLNWLPNGDMVIAQQNGNLKLVEGGIVRTTPILSLGSKVCRDFERGLLGVTVDPQFSTNRLIYIYYTFNKFNSDPNNCPNIGTTQNYPVNRVSRFELDSNNNAIMSSETVLIDNIHSPGGNHNAGDVLFGKDGYLYISVGDGGTDYAQNSGSGGGNDAARDKHVLLGKILRIAKDGSIPPSNPFQGAGTGRCNVNGSTTAGNFCQETWAWGLRNPFRLTLDANSATTRIFINDVGQNQREEIDVGQTGADYGWNCREGTRTNNTQGPCNPTPAGMVDPTFEYRHDSNDPNPIFHGCNSITGGAFVPDGLWPSSYTAGYLFSDYVCGRIFAMTPNGSGWDVAQFGSNLGGVTSLEFGPDGQGQALYYTTYTNGGEIHRVRYTGGGNQAPTAVLEANPTTGTPPLTVNFTAQQSSDPEGGALLYVWSFGDGTSVISTTTPSISHEYASAGTFDATLVVRDPTGLNSNPALVQIDTTGSNQAPSVTIAAPLPTTKFAVGQPITIQVNGSDPEDGALAANRLSIEVLLHHDTHTHPFRSAPNTNTLTLIAPAPEDLAAAGNSYLEIRASAVDSVGATQTITQNLNPNTVSLSLASVPSGARIIVNQQEFTTPTTFVSWEHYALNVSAPTQLLQGQWQRLSSWSDGGTASHIISTPASDQTYTATFEADPRLIWLPSLP